MEKIYLAIGIATFWGFIISIIVGLLIQLVDEIKVSLRVREDIKQQIRDGYFIKYESGGKGWTSKEYHNLKSTDKLITWKDFYSNMSRMTKVICSISL